VGLVIVINFLSYTDLRIQETFLTIKPMYWALVGIHRRTLRDSEFAVSADSSVAIKMVNASRNGDQDRKDLGRSVTSQYLFLGCPDHYAFSANCLLIGITRCACTHRCRKKMKRVERRGTIESQQQREQREQFQQVQQALAIHRSQQQTANTINPPPPSAHSDNGFHDRIPPSSTTGSSLRRTDTVVIGPGMNYDHPSRTTPPPSRPEDVRPQPMYPSYPETIHNNRANGNGTPRAPQEPAMVRARLDSDPHVENKSPSRISDRGKPSASSPSPVGSHLQISTPNGPNKADDIHPPNTNLEEVDNDAEGEEDAEDAELLEAVDAAEEAAHALREKSSGASHAEDPDDVDMKIEQEI